MESVYKTIIGSTKWIGGVILTCGVIWLILSNGNGDRCISVNQSV